MGADRADFIAEGRKGKGGGSAAFSFAAFHLRKYRTPMARLEQMCYNQHGGLRGEDTTEMDAGV